MKGIYILLFIVLAAIKCHALSGSSCLHGGPKFNISVRFGSIPDCRFALSICSITIGPGDLMGTAEPFIHEESGNSDIQPNFWELSISRGSLTTHYPELIISFEGKDSIAFEDLYTLPTEISEKLGVHGELKINANETFPLRFENGEYKITIPCD